MSIRVLGERLFNVNEISTMIPVRRESIYKYLISRKLIGVKIAGQWYVSEGNFKDFLHGKAQIEDKKVKGI